MRIEHSIRPHAGHKLALRNASSELGVQPQMAIKIPAVTVALATFFFASVAASHAQGTASPTMVQVDGLPMRVIVAGLADRRAGQPALILESGAGGDLDEWTPIIDQLAKLAPTVAYDRRGLGKSAYDSKPVTYSHVAQSLHDLLAALRVSPPYVVVGHSMGGPYIRGYSSAYPDEIAGYVYVESVDFETTNEEKAAAVPESQRAEITGPIEFPPIPPNTPPGLLAEINLVKSEMVSGWPEARKFSQKPGVPVSVIIAAPPGRLDGLGTPLMRLQIRHQSEWALESSNGLFIVSGDTRHAVAKDDPELVLLAVRHVLSSIPARSKNP